MASGSGESAVGADEHEMVGAAGQMSSEVGQFGSKCDPAECPLLGPQNRGYMSSLFSSLSVICAWSADVECNVWKKYE